MTSRTEPVTRRVTKTPRSAAVKFPGLCAAAAHMGIHRTTLYRALMGQFPDNGGWVAGYRAFCASREGEKLSREDALLAEAGK